MKRLLRFLLACVALLAASVALYVGVAWALVLFPVPASASAEPVAVQAYVLSNGVHTDLVFPLHSGGVDWTRSFPAQHLAQAPAGATHVAIGWGDREFYLNTPRWQDLTARRALQALSGSGRTLLHVSYLRPADLREARALPLSAQQYAALVAHVQASLQRSADGVGINVPGQHYGAHDAFYEARGAYDLFTTCNVWTGRGLRQAGVTVSLWTPFASQVLWHLRAPEPPSHSL